jgi:phage terminase small subunit
LAEGLTPKQQAFVDAYVGAAKGNATAAARMAGYSDKTAYSIGHENLKKPEIEAAISARASEYAMSPAEVLAELAEIARSDAADVITVPEVGRAYFDFRKAAQNGKLGLIKKLSYNEQGPSVELYDKMSALVQLGKYHKLWTERQEITGKDGAPLTIEMVEIVLPPDSEK